VPKFTNQERSIIKSIVASLSIKRMPDSEIIKEIHQQTNKTITRMGLYYFRQQIKKESYHWYKTIREGQYEYIMMAVKTGSLPLFILSTVLLTNRASHKKQFVLKM
jgi:hypothetical protein